MELHCCLSLQISRRACKVVAAHWHMVQMHSCVFILALSLRIRCKLGS